MSTSFKVLYDGIGLYSDASLDSEVFGVMVDKDSVHNGAYVSDKVVRLDVDGTEGVYCSKINVEEIGGGHHNVAATVVIHADPNELDESPDPNQGRGGPPVPPPVPSNVGNNNPTRRQPPSPPEPDMYSSGPPPVPTSGGPPPVPPPSSSSGGGMPPPNPTAGGPRLSDADMHDLPLSPPKDSLLAAANDDQMIMASDRHHLEERKAQFGHRYDSMSEVKLAEDEMPQRAYTDHGSPVYSTGNSLEDLDNLLRIYRNLNGNDEERAVVYKEFWDKYYNVQEKEPYLLLQIPTRVRGFLTVMIEQDMEPYKRDRIMAGVLSRNGLLEEPTYIRKRYLFSYFIQYEIFDWMRWFCRNCGSAQAWMFLSLWILLLGQVIHVGIDFGRGDPWRAVLMQCLVPITFVAAMQFVDTPFTAAIARTLIENRCAALCTVYGRVSLNAMVIFFCMGSVEWTDILLLFGVFLCVVWTTVIFVEFSRLRHSANYVRIATGSVEKLQEKFLIANDDKDGVLKAVELRNFFKSYNNILRMWQIELMISEFDVYRDGGLRFDALKAWFEKIPINHMTREALLNAKPTDLSDRIYRPGAPQMEAQSSLDGTHRVSGAQGGTNFLPPNTHQPIQYSAAEQEWLGLAGKQYRNQ